MQELRIEIGVEEERGDIIFLVRNNGMGIETGYHANIFGLFNKLDANSEGNGLGLALVKRIVETYGGRIWVDSDGEERGPWLRLTLPKAVKGENRR